jgi:tRNA-2-methylthio-N6-dimethylallyladenosine synthase
MKSFHVTTFGCQMNEHDSERMKGMLESLGYEEVAAREDAQLILSTPARSGEKGGRAASSPTCSRPLLKRADPERVIGVGGCAGRSRFKDQVFAQFPFVDVGVRARAGPQARRVPRRGDSITAQGLFEFEGFTGPPAGQARPRLPGLVQISAGCNMVCSVLHRPLDRAGARSRGPLVELVDEVPRARRRRRPGGHAARGRTSTPTGRSGLARAASFAELLHALDGIEGLDRIRYTSPHPSDMKEDVIRAHAELASVCEHIHLPLQAGSSRVLKRMRRTYTRERFLDRVALIREHVPDCAITTDIIVGFPARARTTSRRRSRWPRRSDSTAPSRSSTRPAAEPRQRASRASSCRTRSARSGWSASWKSSSAVRASAPSGSWGRTLDVLVEGVSRTDASRVRGRTTHNKVVNFDGLASPGEIVPVTITGASSQTLMGEESLLARAAG